MCRLNISEGTKRIRPGCLSSAYALRHVESELTCPAESMISQSYSTLWYVMIL